MGNKGLREKKKGSKADEENKRLRGEKNVQIVLKGKIKRTRSKLNCERGK